MQTRDQIDWHEHKDYQSFCNTIEYQSWLSQWQAPEWQGVWKDFVIYEDLCSGNNPRWHLMNPHQAIQTRLSYWLLDSFTNTGDCVDIGCGDNLFAKYQSNLTGVDVGRSTAADQKLDDAWWVANWGKWPRVFSVSALQFVSLDEWSPLIEKAVGVLARGGEAVISVNRQRIAENEQTFEEDSMKERISQMPFCKKVIWFREPHDACIDGNVWMWFSKDN